MNSVYIYLPRLHWQLGDENYAVVIEQLIEKLAKKNTGFCEVLAYPEEQALEIIDESANEWNREILVITDSAMVAEHCSEWMIPYGVVLCRGNQGDSFPQGAYCMESLLDVEYDYLERIFQRGRGLPWTILETPRLIVREIMIEDVPRLYELYEEEEITAYMEGLFPTIQEEEEYTEKYIKNVYHFYGYGMWVLIEKTSGELIGRAGLEYHDDFDGLELGFMLGKQYWHKGYAYEACNAILEYGKEELEQYSYRALVHFENTASRRLCEKLGFDEYGTVDLNGACHIDYRMELNKKAFC